MNPMQRAASILFAANKRIAGTAVTYSRPDAGSVVVTAVRGKTDAAMPDGNGGAIDARIDDFLIDVADLVIDGEAVVPQAGDRIADALTNTVHEVAGSPAWQWSDVHRTRYRVHVNEIAP